MLQSGGRQLFDRGCDASPGLRLERAAQRRRRLARLGGRRRLDGPALELSEAQPVPAAGHGGPGVRRGQFDGVTDSLISMRSRTGEHVVTATKAFFRGRTIFLKLLDRPCTYSLGTSNKDPI